MNEIDEQLVVSYLESNQHFLQQHPELLTRLSIFHEPSGTTSLVRRQQDLLRNKNQELTTKLNALLENAHTNEHIFKVFNLCYRILLQAPSFEQLATQLEKALIKSFNLLDCKLLAFDSDSHQQLLDIRLTQHTSFLGRLNQDEQLLLFSQPAASAALYLVGDANQPQAILAFASQDETHYHPEQSSIFVLEFIKALEIKLSQL